MDGGSILASLTRLRQQFAGLRWSAVLVVLPLAIYGWYVARQFQQQEEQSQRDLGHAALVLESTVDKALVNVDNLGTNTAFLCQFTREQPYLELVQPCASTPIKEYAPPRLLAAHGGLQIAYGKAAELTFRVRVDLLLRELSFPESFHSLALANSDGLVLLSADAQQPVWLRQLRLDETEYREPAFGENPPQLVSDLKAAAKTGFDEARASSSRFRAELAGKAYQIYLQPLRFQDQKLLLVGFRPTMDVLRQSLAFDTYLLAFLLLLLGGLCLSYPFLKLWSMHPAERFRIRDLLLLYLSTGAILSLCVTVLLALDGYVRYQSFAAALLPQVHSRLESDLISELRAARRQLVAYDACKADLDLPRSVPVENVQVDQVAWADAAGMQTGKLTATAQKAELVSVAHRTYFRAAASGAQWLLPSDASDSASNTPFFFGPSRSITDGQFYSFLSIRSSSAKCQGKPETPAAVAAVLTFSLNSLAPRPLPASFGFALFNREGTLLYHSDERLSLRQNIINESSEPARLRALLLAGGNGWLDAEYHGRPHRFLVGPVSKLRSANGQSGGTLYLAVFQDLSTVRVIAAQAFLSSMLWPQAALAGLMAFAIAVALIISRLRTPDGNWLQWLWTDPARCQQYRAAALLLSVATALSVILHVLQRSWIPSLLLPLITALIAIVIAVWRNAPQQAPQDVPSAARWHRFLLFMLAVSMSLVPAAALFHIIWGQELGRLFALERNQAAALSVDLPARTMLRLQRENSPERWVVRAKQLRRQYMPMDLTVAASERSALPAPYWVQRAQDHLSWALPMRNESAMSIRGLNGPPFAPAWALAGVPLLGALAALLALLWLWTGWNNSHILLSCDILPATPLSAEGLESAWATLSPEERCFLVQVAIERVANPKQSATYLALAAKGWLELAPAVRPVTPAVRAFLLHSSRRSVLSLETDVQSRHSWRSVKASLIAGISFAVLFLFLTQPALPLDFLGLPSFVAAAIGSLVKWSDQLSSLLSPAKRDPV